MLSKIFVLSLVTATVVATKVFSQVTVVNPGSAVGYGNVMANGFSSYYRTNNDAQMTAINNITSEILSTDDGPGLIEKLGKQYNLNMNISKEQRQMDINYSGLDRFAPVQNYWEALATELTGSLTNLANWGGLSPESLEQLRKGVEYLAQNRSSEFKTALRAWMKNYKDHPEFWEDMLATLQAEFAKGNSETSSGALKIVNDIAYDKAFEGLGSQTPKTFNDKDCFKKMSETISKKILKNKSNFNNGHHIAIIHTGCETESNTSITYKYEVSDKGLSNIEVTWVDEHGTSINQAQKKYITSLLKVQLEVQQKLKKSMMARATSPPTSVKKGTHKSTSVKKKPTGPNANEHNSKVSDGNL